MSYVFHNSKIVPISETGIGMRDLSLLRGFGIFDYLRTHNGRPLFLEDYLNRFYASALKMGLEVPVKKEAVASIIDELLTMHAYPESGIRLLLTGGQSADALKPGKPDFCIFVEPFHEPNSTDYSQGIKVITAEYQRFMPEIKSISYMPLIYLRNDLVAKKATDVLYHQAGLVSELSRCNVFYVKKGILYTNDSGILKGITRQKVIELIKIKYQLIFQPIQLKDLMNADEVFLSSTTKKVMPIVQIDDHPITNAKVGEVSKAILVDFLDKYMK